MLFGIVDFPNSFQAEPTEINTYLDSNMAD